MYERKYVSIDEIKKNEENPRTITPKKLEELVQSIKDDPKMIEVRRLVVDENMVVLGGNQRLEALALAGYEKIPVEIVTDWTEEEKRAFIIKDNLSSGSWDYEYLHENWTKHELESFGMDMKPFVSLDKKEVKEDDFKMPAEVKTKIKQGDVITIGPHILLCGDSTKLDSYATLMAGGPADCVLTDPPYNVNYEGKTKDKLKIENDQMNDKQFYQFLFDFYSSSAAYVK